MYRLKYILEENPEGMRMDEIELDTLQNFDKKRAVDRITEFVQTKIQESGLEKLIIGLSGGVDSSVTTKLLSLAVEPENITALFLPDELTPTKDEKDARSLCEKEGIEFKKLSIDEIITTFQRKLELEVDKKTIGNLKARTRMLFLYAYANQKNGLVSGTSDRSEWLIGYFTKWGDGAADFSPIRGLYKTQVRELGKYLGISERIIEKPSSPRLWEGQTAKSELGFSYEDIDRVLYAFFDLQVSREKLHSVTGVSKESVKKILKLHRMSKHKRTVPPSLRPLTS